MRLLTFKTTRKWKKVLLMLASIVFGGFFVTLLADRPSAHQFILYREEILTDEEKLQEMGSRYAAQVISPNEATVYVQPTNLTKWYPSISQQEKLNRNEIVEVASSPALRILIVVTSTPNSFERREMIRSSWKKWTLPGRMENVKIVFFVGLPKTNYSADSNKKLTEESECHNDLIIDDFTESYFRLTPKTLRILKWYLQTYPASQSQSSPNFLVKTDHDVFINIPNLVAHLTSVAERTPSNYLGGRVYSNPELDLNPKSKFYFSPQFWLNSSTPMWVLKFKTHFRMGKSPLPDYVAGPCYIMSADVVHLLYQASFRTPMIIFEDAYLTGFVRNEVNLTLSHISRTRISIKLDKSRQILEDTEKLKKVLALHPAEPPELMLQAFDKSFQS